MLHAFGFGSRTTRALAGAVVGLVALVGTAAACPDDLRDIGKANVQGGGFWGIDVTTRDNVIAGGYTYAVVTDQACASTSATAVMFETRLAPTESGDGTWVGLLAPLSPAAERVAAKPNFEGQVVMEPAGSGTRVTSYLQNLPEGRDFRVCLGTAGH